MKSGFININKAFVLFSIGLLAGCGSGSDDETATTAVSGSVFASYVGGASVTVKDTAGNTVAGPATTAADGTFTIQVPSDKLSQDLVFDASGGTFTDEASGETDVASEAMGAYVEGGTLSPGAEVHITPSSTIVRDLVRVHGKTHAAAKAAFESAFGQKIDLSIAPLDAAATPPVGATEDQLRAGLRAAAFSQLAKDLGEEADHQFHIFEHLTEDLADDGVLNGIPGHIEEDIQNRYVRALINFRNSGKDKTGLTADKIGTLPFAKVALTDDYRIAYLPGMMGAMEGKTQFSLDITDRTTGYGVSGLTVELIPVMYMSTMSHGTAVDGCVENLTTIGRYDCTLYYLMASSMAGGMSMGYWELGVNIDDGTTSESTFFYPDVMMAMGDTIRAVLKGQSDQIAGMMGMGMPEKRNYYLFKDGISGVTGNHTFDLFVAARENMMSHPAVSVGTVLNDGDPTYEYSVGTMTVEVSTDQSNWITATDNGNGHWSASGITGLIDGVSGTLYVRLTVNGEPKTTNGYTPAGDGTNDYGIFSVTP